MTEGGTVWIGEDYIGELAAISVSLSRSPESPGVRGIAGTVVFTKLDFDMFDKHFPKHKDDFTKIPEVVVKLPYRDSMVGTPRVVTMLGFVIWNEGWGWTEDDLTNEYAVTWTADDYDYDL